MTKPTSDADRAAALALSSAQNFLECLRVSRLPGRANARRALLTIRQAVRQHRRAAALLEGAAA
jgi:hypothetical protein